jgi:hypothetical protein
MIRETQKEEEKLVFVPAGRSLISQNHLSKGRKTFNR